MTRLQIIHKSLNCQDADAQTAEEGGDKESSTNLDGDDEDSSGKVPDENKETEDEKEDTPQVFITSLPHPGYATLLTLI